MNHLVALTTDQFKEVLKDTLNEALQTTSQPIDDEYLSMEETVKKLKSSKNTLRKYVNKGSLNCYRFGKKILFKKLEIDLALTKIKFSDKY